MGCFSVCEIIQEFHLKCIFQQMLKPTSTMKPGLVPFDDLICAHGRPHRHIVSDQRDPRWGRPVSGRSMRQVGRGFWPGTNLTLNMTTYRLVEKPKLQNKIDDRHSEVCHSGEEPDMEPLLTAPEVAKLLRISQSQAYALIRRGVIPAVRLGRSVRVKQDELEGMIARMSAEAGPSLGSKGPQD